MSIVKSERHLRAAEILLDCGIVNVTQGEPFVFTSGWHSPVYINVRGLLFEPQARNEIVMQMAHHIENHIGLGEIDVYAGGETAGIPFAAMIAEYFHKPMVYVRKKPKGFGMNAQIEGGVIEGRRALLIEDLTTDGKTKIDFANVLRGAGAPCLNTISVFFYGVYPGVDAAMKTADLRLHYLCDWQSVLDVGRASNRFSPDQLENIESFLADPIAWSERSKQQTAG